MLKRTLQKHDSELYDLIVQEFKRQREGIELIASENFTPQYVLDCLGSVLTNKYSEGQVGQRYYGGNKYIDKIESLCKKRALQAFDLDSERWTVNVQPYSGSVANVAAYLSVLKPGDRIMGLDLPSGGHLSHGYYTKNKPISSTSIIFQSFPYTLNDSGYINYDKLEETAKVFLPKLIICGASAYPRDLDYQRFRQIANTCGAYLLADIAHISGLVVTKEANNPFTHCDLVTTTTHKTFQGPRSGMIFSKKELGPQVDFSVFPGLQGGPHNHQIAGVCTQLKYIMTPEFKSYIKQVKSNAQALASKLITLGYELSSGGTDNHLILICLRNKGLTGSKVEKICELVGISLNKNAVYGDKNAMILSGIRVGTPAMTSRGLVEPDFIQIALFFDQCVNLCQRIQQKSGVKIKDFLNAAKDFEEDIGCLQGEIKDFINHFDFY